MSNLFPKRNSLPRKGKHWSQRLRETVLDRNPSGHFNLHLVGGAENGEFISLGEFRQDKLKYRKGKLHEGDIFLEINGQPVAGYTAFDVLALIKASGSSVTLRSVKPGLGITKDLKQFLAARYEERSIDMELQQTIRDNLYKRTIPCTTRTPRKGEQPGLDYVFLSMEEFERLEKSGNLLESGKYDGNHYGTPKPPAMDPSRPENLTFPQMNNSHAEAVSQQQRSGESRHLQAQPATQQRRREKASQPIQANHFGHEDQDYYRGANMQNHTSEEERQSIGPLPPNWEIAYSENNEKYFIDHNTGTTQWLDPRLSQVTKSDREEFQADELPYGWEKIEDPKYGTYYIDHVSRKTQFENPIYTHKKNAAQYNNSSHGDLPSHVGPPNLQTAAALAKAQEAEAMSRWPDVEFSGPEPPAYTVSSSSNREMRMYPYGKNNGYQQGTQEQEIRTMLYKGSRGFGFTIVGGDQPGELLQIKSIVPDGAASKDGILRMGDALVRVNGMSVLSKTHQDVVNMFQAMPIGEAVELEMIRGYPLPFDPDDPNVETIGSYTVVRAPTQLEPPKLRQTPSDQSLTSSTASSPPPPPVNNKPGFQRWQDIPGPNDTSYSQQPHVPPSSTFPRTSTSVSMQPQTNMPGELLQAHVVKGGMGFGFTIADSPYGQKVKQILDAPRCTELQEGDILVEINGRPLHRCTHNEAVNILKECPRGQQAVMLIQRGVIPTSMRNSTSNIRRDQDEDQPVQRVSRPKSTPVLTSAVQNRPEPQGSMGGSLGNLATAGESTKNHDTESEGRENHPQVDKSSAALFASYPSLRRAVASAAARRSMENLNGPLHADVSNFNDEGLDVVVHLKRGDMGFGFRIIGGKEESTQVAIGTLVAGGPADLDGRLRRGDEILFIDGISVVGSTHRRVISLMGNAALAGEVSLGIRRRPNRSGRSTPNQMRRSASTSSQLSQSALVSPSAREASRSAGNLMHYGSELRDTDETGSVRSFRSTPGDLGTKPAGQVHRDRRRSEGDAIEPLSSPAFHTDITLERGENEGFGFVILSSVHKSGSTIGRIIQGSPADRCRRLHVGDRLVAVNGASIVGMHHSDIVEMIKQSGMRVTLKIAQRPSEDETRRLSRSNMPEINHSGFVNRDRLSSGNSDQTEGSRYREELMQKSRQQFLYQQPQQDTNQQRGSENTRATWKPQEPSHVRESSSYPPAEQTAPPKKAPPPVLPKPSRDKLRQTQEDPHGQKRPARPSSAVESSRSHSYANGPRERSRSGSFQRPRTSGQLQMVELERGQRGYGFSIRGGRELNMPVFVLRMAEDGPAYRDGRLQVGDELVEINGHSTASVLHAEAIELIRSGGNRVRLLIRRGPELPNGGQAAFPQSYSTSSMPRARPDYHSGPPRGASVYSH